MDNAQAFQEFLATQTPKVPLLDFGINLILTFALAYGLRLLYVRHAQSLANRQRFASNLPIVALTTMIIITVVKSSLALSLGLVGALSIVRFRTAIKDPEELSYLFITIALGLGFGAGQRAITIIGFAVLIAAILLKTWNRRTRENSSVFLTVSGRRPGKLTLEQMARILREHCLSVDLKRLDESNDELEATFVVEFENFETLEKARACLAEADQALRLTLLDHGFA